MSLRDKIEAKPCRTKEFELDGDKYLIKAVSKRVYSSLYAQARNKTTGVVDNEKFESLLLCHCACDLDGSQIYPPQEFVKWSSVPAYLTVPLVSECLKFNGHEVPESKDNADPKDSGSTPS